VLAVVVACRQSASLALSVLLGGPISLGLFGTLVVQSQLNTILLLAISPAVHIHFDGQRPEFALQQHKHPARLRWSDSKHHRELRIVGGVLSLTVGIAQPSSFIIFSLMHVAV
jgi:hypothetical protein